MHWRRCGNPLQCSCLENPRDGGPGGLLSLGLHRVGHDWSDLAAAVAALVLCLSRILESVLPLQRLRALLLSKDQPRSNLPKGISPKMKGPLLEVPKPVHKNTMEISDSAETQYCFLPGQASLNCNRCLEGLSFTVVSSTLPWLLS